MKTPADSEIHSGDAASEGNSFRAGIDGLATILANDAFNLKADVLLPTDSKLAVQLVKLDDLLRYRELADDETIVSNSLFTLIGALFGTTINLATSESPTINRPTWIVMAALLAATLATFSYWCRMRKRAALARMRIFPEAST